MINTSIRLQKKIKEYLQFDKSYQMIEGEDIIKYHKEFIKHIGELKELFIKVGFDEKDLSTINIVKICKEAETTTLLDRKII